MKPRIQLASAPTPDGGEISLHRHDRDFSIRINGQELMHSRRHESERELARLGCAHLAGRRTPRILIGGLGMGYTLRAALEQLGGQARVVVAELLGAVVDWNRDFLGELNGHPLRDKRVEVVVGDVVEWIRRSKGRFDAILLDIDNGPSAMTDARNRRLYDRRGICACHNALRKHGCLAIWSAEPNKKFERLLMYCHFQVRRYRVPAYPGAKAPSRFVWVASEDVNALPPGGGEPLPRPREAKREAAAQDRRSASNGQ